ncbi:LPXTG cell wall anchor domain-containing protein [Mammaliicoccus stepanovicii]|uniref:Gram-positive cocci surface proteins LPxTG domain-containing protein n=1 Tax=Mammaliicoccus stepanovicii TaxID=643214 RepID=A0A239YT21_9STAP|nr:LPXTG cell wall anchor domain-containing protein [Mammaliicoccus stepanovicii]PNZ73217.1 hypothetical protein CD111_09990 [Mammaliicoccus stepanovicii]GGI42389.1 hypothetical protein GCM10010896_18180 [Mammaliicoccus stepanovicii]SNV61526.1 Uncharacterised protein [Mammaliicoccus stepanovicii]
MLKFASYVVYFVCLITALFFTNNLAKANSDTTTIGLQFVNPDNSPIPNETFQIQLNNESKTLTTKSDGLAFIHIPNTNLKPNYVITTSNQQTFTIEPNKLYKLTASTIQQRQSANLNNQSVSINVISNKFKPLNNMDIKLTINNQEFLGKTNDSGSAIINIPESIPKDSAFNVFIQNIDTHSSIHLGEDKYYTFNNNDKTVAPNVTNQDTNTQPLTTIPSQSNSPNTSPSTNSNSDNQQNNTFNYQLSIVNDNLNSEQKQTAGHDSSKKSGSNNKKLPETGEKSSHYFKYIVTTLILCISFILFFIIKRKRVHKAK